MTVEKNMTSMDRGTPSEDDRSGLRNAVRVFKRRRLMIIACVLLVPVAAVVSALLSDKEYSATTAVLFRDPAFDQKLFDSSYLPASRDPAREAATNVRLASLEQVARVVASTMPGETADSVQSKVEVQAEGQSDIVNIVATDTVPRRAADLANSWATTFIAVRRDADRAKIRQAQQVVDRQIRELPAADRRGAQGRDLTERANQLEVLASLQTGNAEIAERAQVPTSPSAPRPVRSGVLGVFGGIVLALLLVMVIERLDRRIRDTDEFETLAKRPILATIQRGEGRRARSSGQIGGVDLEGFRILRSNLRYFNLGHAVRVVAVTSAQPGEGKSTVALNLAQASAQAGVPTLLVEADLRRPSQRQATMNNAASAGLSDVLAEQASLEDALVPVPAGNVSGASEAATIDVLFAGPTPPNPVELLDSDAMRALLSSASQRYGLVVIDTPPATVVADAIPILTEADGVLVVGRLNLSTRERQNQLFAQLERINARILGVVVNFAQPSDGYSYRSGYYAAAPVEAARRGADASKRPSPAEAPQTEDA